MQITNLSANTYKRTHTHIHILCTATWQRYSHFLWDNTNGVKWLFITASRGLSSREFWVIKFPLREYRVNCACVYVCVGVCFITLSKLQRKKGT